MIRYIFLLVVLVAIQTVNAAPVEPMRPLPEASKRPLTHNSARSFFVDGTSGNDKSAGDKQTPWLTINHAVHQLRPGDTLYLRAGTYYEHVELTRSGTETQPITIRSFPGELVTVDGGLREFLDDPTSCWKPLHNGAEHEFVSTKTYPQFSKRPIVSVFPAAGWEPFYGKEEERPVVLGHFADSMVPLHGYRTLTDLRDTSMLWDVTNKFQKDEGVYCGPGLWFNRDTNRIHIRLAHTTLQGLGKRHYRGETDPRKIPLCVSGPYGSDVLRINGIKHVNIQDVALRGASGSPLINMYGSDGIVFDGVTVFGGSPGLLAKASSKIRILNCAFRGLSAPWSSRASMKYRGTPSYRLITQRNKPQSNDWEIAYSEFTDDHDGIWLRYVKNLKFHHNLVDNFNDDGLEFGARKIDQEIYVYQNLISRCLLTLTLHEMDRGESPAEVDPGSGVYITRNIFDLRQGVFKGLPKEEDPTGAYLKGTGVLCSDHGGPTWPNYFFYHNTVLRKDSAWRGYYGFGIGGQATRRTTRRVFNNIFVQLEGIPGLVFGSGPDDTLVNGNLHWGVIDGPKFEGDFFKKQSGKAAFRRIPLPETWMTADQFADPKFANLGTDPRSAFNITLKKDSPSIDAGVPVPESWLDPIRTQDIRKPDIGALPSGTAVWTVGINGRIRIGDRK
jgi:hypothetical protein